MIAVAEICLGIHYDTDPLIVGTSRPLRIQ